MKRPLKHCDGKFNTEFYVIQIVMDRLGHDEDEIFKKIPEIVWLGLRQDQKSISELEKERGTLIGDPVQNELRDRAVWQNKRDIDVFVANKLNIDIDVYGTKTRSNAIYNKVVNVISDLRLNGKIIDWRYGYPRYGIWRLASSTEKREIVNFKNGNFSSPPKRTSVAGRTKQTQFRNKLLISFNHCLFCEFRVDTYLRAAHIVPFVEMQKCEPENTMNPKNGLLLCTLCDIAFERGDITVDEDYHVCPTKELKTMNESTTTNDCWLSKMDGNLRIKDPSKLIPDTRYLKWKMKLNNS